MTSRYERQQELVPIEQLSQVPVQVVGTGAVGRQVCIQLAAMGVPSIEIVDFDTVEEVNLAPQGFREKDLGRPKVEAVADVMREMNSEIEITPQNRRWSRGMVKQNAVVFCCVDSMDTRSLLFDSYANKAGLFIDGRMAAESLRVFTFSDQQSAVAYKETLFSDDQAFVGRCTARSTIYGATLLASIETSMLAKWLRRFPLERNINMNILTSDFEVAS